MVGKAHKSALVVIIDRATLLIRLKKITSRHADSTELAIEERLARIPKAFIKTVTVDNDKAFANHRSLARTLDADVYFTRPYTSASNVRASDRWLAKALSLSTVTVLMNALGIRARRSSIASSVLSAWRLVIFLSRMSSVARSMMTTSADL